MKISTLKKLQSKYLKTESIDVGNEESLSIFDKFKLMMGIGINPVFKKDGVIVLVSNNANNEFLIKNNKKFKLSHNYL